MKNLCKITLIGFLALLSMVAVSCSGGLVEKAKDIVINEIMASNRTGLVTGQGKASDWIELKNNSTDSIDLKDFQLAVIKARPDSIPEDQWEEKVKTWTFPKVTIKAGENLVVFAEKVKKPKKAKGQSEDAEIEEEESDDEKQKEWTPGTDLIANFNIPKDGGTVQFLAPNGDVITEVKFGKQAPDQALARQANGSYAPTYLQSPGFDNDRKGYEAASEKMDGQRKDPLKIWEVMSRAANSYENWVELKNTGSKSINLSQYAIGKKNSKKDRWQLPDVTLEPGQIYTVQLAGSKRARSANQAPFKMGNAETIVLVKDGKFVDGICAKPTPRGGSVGRIKGKKGFFFFSSPSRDGENSENGKRFIAESPRFDHKPGVYAKEKKLTLKLKDKNQVVHYTLDGTEPTSSSPVLKDSLLLTKGTVVRTFVEGDSLSLRSNTATATYLLDVKHDIPVMNISVRNGDLYDHSTGIYANGPGYGGDWPYKGANFWKDWTKNAHVEFFDNREGKEGFSTDCGLKIFGGFSRAEPKKSFRLKFRGEYGNQEIDYDFFGNGNPVQLEDLVLRSGSQDYARCMVRDEFFTSLMKENSPNILTQVYRPVALYVNAQYFGLYYLREKIDKNFVARQLNVPNDSISILMSIGYVEEGKGQHYQDLVNFATSHDMKNKENYEHVKKNFDLVGLIDYKLGEMYSGNTDVGNIRYVRSTDPKSDKKWHCVFYDLDATWVGDKPSMAFYLTTGPVATQANVVAHNKLINALLSNNEFRQLFLSRVSHHMKTTFQPKNANRVFDNLVGQIRNEMKYNCERWPQLSYETWEKNIDAFKKKFDTKPKIMLDGLREYLNITDAENKKYFAGLGF